MVTIIASVITGILALAGVIITNSSSNRAIENKLTTNQAITDTKLENLTEEVRRHNSFATEIPTMKVRIDMLENSVKELKDR